MFSHCFGERGALSLVGQKVQCHICGKPYHHLGAHVVRTHELSADEYTDEFGLKRTTGLISPALAEKRRRHMLSRDPEQRNSARSLAVAARRDNPCPRTWRVSLEQRLSPACRMLTSAPCPICGKAWTRHRWPSERVTCSPECARQLVAQRVSAARGGVSVVECSCVVCGHKWQALRPSRRRTCSSECFAQWRRSRVESMQTEAAREKIRQAAKRRDIRRDASGRIVTWRRPDEEAVNGA